MRTICIISSRRIDLLNARIIINDRVMELCGLAREEYKDGQLWQWWIAMEDGKQKKQA